MDEKNVQLLNNIYMNFRNRLFNNINNSDTSLFTQQSEDCYLVEDLWNNELLNYMKENNQNKQYNVNLNNNISFPTIIKDFDNIIYNIDNFHKLKLVNKKLIESLPNKTDLKDLPVIQYYGGNNKIIIEYKNKKDNKALLVLNPLDDKIMKYKIFILLVDNNSKLSLYKDLLSEIDTNISLNQNYKKFVISFYNYC